MAQRDFFTASIDGRIVFGLLIVGLFLSKVEGFVASLSLETTT
jgi:hypothetical protein